MNPLIRGLDPWLLGMRGSAALPGLYYKGVDSLGESSVNLLFIATVKEADFYVVQRALNREIKMIFDENNVCIPFPQVTINEPGKFNNKTKAKEHKKASEFATEQRTVSKTMEETNKKRLDQSSFFS